MKRWWTLLGVLCLLAPAAAQDESCPLPTRLSIGDTAHVLLADGDPLNVRETPGLGSTPATRITRSQLVKVVAAPVCADDIVWLNIESPEVSGWIAEGDEGEYYVSPANYLANWTWGSEEEPIKTPDPVSITLPTRYAGDMPSLPVDLNSVQYIDDAALNEAQLALLAENGFVIVPGDNERFQSVYRDWGTSGGTSMGEVDENGIVIDPIPPNFITTDSMLNVLYDVFHQLLVEMEKATFSPAAQTMLANMTVEALAQYEALRGTPLEAPARDTLVYLATGLQLMVKSMDERGISLINALDALPADIVAEAQTVTELIEAADGQSDIPFLEGYREDFGAYKVRGHYEGDPVLESYFQAMNWLGRVTFRASNADETLSALLLTRAMKSSSYEEWFLIHDTLSYIVGPVDDLTPTDYLTLAETIFGADLSLEALSDPAKLQAFREGLAALPGPRINGVVLPAQTPVADVNALTMGFRLMGQRFTFDGYVLGQLFAPAIDDRMLPSALDVAAVLGSDTALALSDGSSSPKYEAQFGPLRAEAAALHDDDWHETLYGGWLWTLSPLWNREHIAAYPPLMQTEAWARRDLQTGLASYTQLKHATVLYAKQPTGFGGGGPPLLAYGYVEPNPLVFARLAILTETAYRRLEANGVMPLSMDDVWTDEQQSLYEMSFYFKKLSGMAAELAVMAEKELTGEPLTENEYYFIQQGFANWLQLMDAELYNDASGTPVPPVALVTDIATNGTFSTTVQVGLGRVDYIYVVIPGPRGYQLARGGVYSYYEFVGSSSDRLTDSVWRESVANGTVPPRPTWVNSFVSE